MNKLIKISLLLIAIVFVSATSVKAEQKWIADIGVYFGDDSKHVVFGGAENATAGFDGKYDATARFMSGSRLVAYFDYPGWGLRTNFVRVDMRDLSLPQEYVFYVSSAYTNQEHTMVWDLSNVPGSAEMSLYDSDADITVDMRSVTEYRYMNTSSIKREFTVIITGSVSDTVAPDTNATVSATEFTGYDPIDISFSGSDDVTDVSELLYSYKVDDGAWSGWGGDSAQISGLSDGVHNVYVKARDNSGNEDPTPAAIAFRVSSP